ncbi:MAG: hypothetical protein WC570_00950 [Patescibacteria group bacterium]
MEISIESKQGVELDQYPVYTMPVIVSSIVVLLVTLIVGGALMYMDSSQAKQTAALNDQIAVIDADIKKKDVEGEVFKQAERMTKATKIFDDYVAYGLDWDKFLTKLGDITLNEVTYSSFIVNRSDRSFSIDGVAPSYRVIAEQLNVFKNEVDFQQVVLKTAVLRPDSESASRVAFSLELKPTAEAFKTEVVEEDVFNLISGDEEVTTDNADMTVTSN